MRNTIFIYFIIVVFGACNKETHPQEAIQSLTIYSTIDQKTNRIKFTLPFSDTLIYELNVGDNIEDLRLVISGPTGPLVQSRYITSLAISDEGSHLDLINWLHYCSEWKKVKIETTNIYNIGEYTGKIESEKFPDIKAVEIANAIPVNANSKWRILAQQCNTATTMPCYVTISQYLIKIENPGTKPVLIKIIVPMGD